MRTAAIGTRARADVGSRCAHTKTARRERIFDTETERKWVAGLRIEDVFHENLVRFARNGPPSGPADEPMNCVVALGFVERQLVATPIELVVAILQPVGPGYQDLTARRRAHLILPVPVKKLPSADGVCAKPAANFDDDCALAVGRDLSLRAGGCDHGAPQISSAMSANLPRRGASEANATILFISGTPRTFRDDDPRRKDEPQLQECL